MSDARIYYLHNYFSSKTFLYKKSFNIFAEINGAATYSITTLGIMAFSIMTFSITTLVISTFSIIVRK